MTCGSVVRLQHLQTRLFLHSHKFSAPLSGNQEVSCFGDGNVGDTGTLQHVHYPRPHMYHPCIMNNKILCSKHGTFGTWMYSLGIIMDVNVHYRRHTNFDNN